ncbi:hypothetical protein [uncultured Ruegeria sp.]|uniref:hypothetical protein n=1 Tax=uncultured Ruegeria sp. TaxID=259304 RepID=UPI0026113DD0|nr:hypothetical protein [uncultured Ruegeria sp.]
MYSYESNTEFPTDNGYLEYVQTGFDYDTEFFPADPTIGQFGDEYEVTARVEWVNFSGLRLTREQLLIITSKSTVEEIEASVAEQIRNELEAGNLEAA